MNSRYATAALLCAVLLVVPLARAATLKVAAVAPDGTTWMKEIRAGGKRISELTEGRVKLKFYPGSVMGNDQSVLRKIRVGQLQGGVFTGGALGQVDPNTYVYNLPMLFLGLEEVHYVRERVDDAIRDSLADNGMIAVGFGDGGLAYVMLSEPAASLEQLRQRKVWIPEGDPITAKVFELGGINAVPLPISDVYTGLQTGLLDTVTTTPTAAIAFQWHTRINYIIDYPLGYVNGYLLLSKKAFARLSEGDQQIVRDVMRDVFVRLDEYSEKDNRNALQALLANGVKLIELSVEEKQRWQEIAALGIEHAVSEGQVSEDIWREVEQHITAFRSQAKARD
ncbi:MAG: TRAP transporter substrate-binding protein DctP [Gammaproteobacteria bacterium]|nr:TRAP transporter substrate-binding protein DctP [Gammaproteobacteria bacterium]